MKNKSTVKLQKVIERAEAVSGFLKALSNPQRLRIVCLVMERQRPVGELAEAADLNQSTVSQHLTRLRRDGILATRREGKSVYYHLADESVEQLLSVLQSGFSRRR
jgi:DNA-binding transcriptional ArsR family regulator